MQTGLGPFFVVFSLFAASFHRCGAMQGDNIMGGTKYTYHINSMQLKNGTPFVPGRINVFVGANNCGKTQLLKDMLSYITGSNVSPVILNEMDVTYPDTWEAFKDSYEMNIAQTAHGIQLRHISPTLDADPSGPTRSDLEDRLQRWLQGRWQ